MPWAAASERAQAVAGQEVLEVFVRDGCPHCAEAKEFLPTFASERPGLRIVLRPVDHDAVARDDLMRYSRNAGIWPPGVPTFVFDGQVLVGFESAERTGPELAALVRSAFGAFGKRRDGTVRDAQRFSPGPAAVHPGAGFARRLQSLRDVGIAVSAVAAGAPAGPQTDGAGRRHVRARQRRCLLRIHGRLAQCLPAVGHFSHLALGSGRRGAGHRRGQRQGFLGPGQGFSLSIPASAKPGLYARMRAVLGADTLLPSLTGVAALAVAVNFIELLCTAGFPAIYTAVLAQQGLSPSAHYAYLGLYILGYIADDTVMVATAVVALSSRKLSERAGRWLKLLSGAVMLALGGVMILRPEWAAMTGWKKSPGPTIRSTPLRCKRREPQKTCSLVPFNLYIQGGKICTAFYSEPIAK